MLGRDLLWRTNRADQAVVFADWDFAHKKAPLPRPEVTMARDVLKTYKHKHAEKSIGIRKPTPVTVDRLKMLVGDLDEDTPANVRDWALLLVGFAMGARRSELAALNLADLRVTIDGLEVTVRVSKTDKGAHGRVAVVPPYGKNGETCRLTWRAKRAAPVGSPFVMAAASGAFSDDQYREDALQALVHRLCGATGRDTTRSRPTRPGYRLAVEPDAIDAQRFARLVAAARRRLPLRGPGAGQGPGGLADRGVRPRHCSYWYARIGGTRDIPDRDPDRRTPPGSSRGPMVL